MMAHGMAGMADCLLDSVLAGIDHLSGEVHVVGIRELHGHVRLRRVPFCGRGENGVTERSELPGQDLCLAAAARAYLNENYVVQPCKSEIGRE